MGSMTPSRWLALLVGAAIACLLVAWNLWAPEEASVQRGGPVSSPGVVNGDSQRRGDADGALVQRADAVIEEPWILHGVVTSASTGLCLQARIVGWLRETTSSPYTGEFSLPVVSCRLTVSAAGYEEVVIDVPAKRGDAHEGGLQIALKPVASFVVTVADAKHGPIVGADVFVLVRSPGSELRRPRLLGITDRSGRLRVADPGPLWLTAWAGEMRSPIVHCGGGEVLVCADETSATVRVIDAEGAPVRVDLVMTRLRDGAGLRLALSTDSRGLLRVPVGDYVVEVVGRRIIEPAAGIPSAFDGVALTCEPSRETLLRVEAQAPQWVVLTNVATREVVAGSLACEALLPEGWRTQGVLASDVGGRVDVRNALAWMSDARDDYVRYRAEAAGFRPTYLGRELLRECAGSGIPIALVPTPERVTLSLQRDGRPYSGPLCVREPLAAGDALGTGAVRFDGLVGDGDVQLAAPTGRVFSVHGSSSHEAPVLAEVRLDEVDLGQARVVELPAAAAIEVRVDGPNAAAGLVAVGPDGTSKRLTFVGGRSFFGDLWPGRHRIGPERVLAIDPDSALSVVLDISAGASQVLADAPWAQPGDTGERSFSGRVVLAGGVPPAGQLVVLPWRGAAPRAHLGLFEQAHAVAADGAVDIERLPAWADRMFVYGLVGEVPALVGESPIREHIALTARHVVLEFVGATPTKATLLLAPAGGASGFGQQLVRCSGRRRIDLGVLPLAPIQATLLVPGSPPRQIALPELGGVVAVDLGG
jgi:hypothetical protein